MVHDILVAAFADVHCVAIHPCKKNLFNPGATDPDQAGKWTKKNTKSIAKRYFSADQWKAIGKKKDDIADSVV
jgi:hypothetical protein